MYKVFNNNSYPHNITKYKNQKTTQIPNNKLINQNKKEGNRES